MSLRRTLLDLHRQSHKLSRSNPLPFSMSNISAASPVTATSAAAARHLSSIPFALAQKLKPDSTNLVTDRSISSLLRQSPGQLQISRGYTNRSFLPKLHLLYHINEGMEEVLADYVHQEMTRNLMVISLGLFQFIFLKDVFVFLFLN